MTLEQVERLERIIDLECADVMTAVFDLDEDANPTEVALAVARWAYARGYLKACEEQGCAPHKSPLYKQAVYLKGPIIK